MENNKKKTDISFIIITMFLLIVLIGSSIFGIITFARYRTRASGDIEARIAKWSFKVNGEEEFFSTINLADTIDFAEVEKGKIAPGTNGSFNLIIDGSGSEVSLDYYISLDIINKPYNMKFYSDSTHTTELPITEDDKILLEDEILLSNINTPITQIIYWDWSYRTDEMPSEAVLTEYGLNKAEIDAQIAAASTQEERENIIKLTNDKIDTQDEGGEVLISASIKGVQKNPLGFVQKGIYITSDTNKEYSIGEEVTFVAEFTEGVYGDNGEQLTEETVPVLELWFDVNDNEETANLNNNLIAKVSSLENANLNLAEENIQSRIAEFVCVDRNKIMYSYTIDVGDAGILKVLSYTGMVYNKKNSSIEVQTQELKGVKVFDNADGILEVYAPFDSTVLKDNIQNEAFSVNGNITFNTSNKKAGSGSAYFSGEEGQCLRLNRDGLNFGTSDFTIDFWLYAEQQTSNYPTIISDNANSSLQFQIDNIKLSNTVSNTLISTEKAYKVNEWVFYRIIRKDGIFYLYENGKMVGSTDGYKSTSINLSSLAIGGNSANSTAFMGYIDELKIYNIALQGDLTTTTRNEYIAINESYTYGINNTSESIAFWGRRFSNSDFVWTSTNNDVASVDRNGNIRGLSIGYSTIVGTNAEYGIKVLGIVNVHSNRTGAITVPQVLTGAATAYNVGNTYVLKENGTVWSMGNNNYGQLGDGTNNSSNIPVQVKIDENTYLTDIIKISGGHTCVEALRKDGTVWSWGNNDNGQLGNGTNVNKNYATQVNNLNKKIIDIGSGFLEQSALDENGNVYVWGRGNLGVLGNGSTSNKTAPQKANINNVIKISQKEHELALTTAGEVYGWGGYGVGSNVLILSSNYTIPQKLTDDAVDIIALERDSLILKLDEYGNKKLYGCGCNQGDELQVGNTNSVAYLKEIVNLPQSVINGNAEIKYISGGQGNIQLVLSDGTVWMNGKNNCGVLANGTTIGTSSFVQMQDENGVINNVLMPGYEVSWIDNGLYSFNSSVIKKDGIVWACGNNSYGQFGNGTTTSSNVLVHVGNVEIKLNVRNEYIKINENLNIQILKGGLFNWFVEGSTINKNDWDWISTNEDVASVNDGIVLGKSVGYTTIICYNEELDIKGMVIVNVYSNRTGAITVPQVLMGSETIYYEARNTYVLKEDGTVWSMGNNNYGQLGNGTNSSSNVPVQVKIDENTYLTDVIKISGGNTSVEALRKDGTVWSWGNNDNGQLGDGTTISKTYATQVRGLTSKIVDITSGFVEQSALDENGNVYVWGRGILGVLGNGSTTNYVTLPQKANISNVIKISQKEHELGLTTTGEVYGWGGSGIGPNALILSSNYTLPQKMTDNAVDIIAIDRDSLILKLDDNGNKKLYGCGCNQGDELQAGNTNAVTYLKEIVNLPQSVLNGTAEIKYISGGQGNIQLVLSDGTVWMNGKNNYGVLANGTTIGTSSFVQMQDENGVINNVLMPVYEVSWIDNGLYSINSGVIKRDGTVWICGDNSYGQFGNGTTTSSNVLVQVGIDFNVFTQNTVAMIMMLNDLIDNIF